jgi:hypothetical protein
LGFGDQGNCQIELLLRRGHFVWHVRVTKSSFVSKGLKKKVKLPLCDRLSDVHWIGLAQDGDRWRALVNSVLNLRAP